MNPRSSATAKEKTEHRLTPFEQISEVETSEEQRVHATLQTFEREEIEAEQKLKEERRSKEEAMRDEARAELKEFAKSEPAAILAQYEADTQGESQHISAEYKKHAPAISRSLVESIIDCSFLSHS